MTWFFRLSLANKIALISLFVAVIAIFIDKFSDGEKNDTGIVIGHNNSIGGDVVGGDKIISNKGTNYGQENSKKQTSFFQEYKSDKAEIFSYKININGNAEIQKNFKPFRIEKYGNDPMVFAFKSTLNSNKPFYTINQKFLDYDGMVPIYDCPDYGYPQFIKITNITDYGEDIVFDNTLTSIVKRIGDANRVVGFFDMGGTEAFIKTNRKIKLQDGQEKIKFKNTDFVTLRSGETIILEIPYIAEKTGRYLPSVNLTFTYAGSKGKLTIEPHEIIVPEIIIWAYHYNKEGLYDSISELKDIVHFNGKLDDGSAISRWDEKNKEYVAFDFSSKKLKEDDLYFIGKANLRYYINEVYAKKGVKFKSQNFNDYFNAKLKEKYKPIIDASEFDEKQLSETEKYNIDLSAKIEKLIN